jgi:hypothetical protein
VGEGSEHSSLALPHIQILLSQKKLSRITIDDNDDDIELFYEV